MASGKPFEHIALRQVYDAPPKKLKPRGGSKPNPQTEYYWNNRQEHATQLDRSREIILMDWHNTQKQRHLDNLPDTPEALSLFLQIDPDLSIEELRSLGIEVVGELEDGFIIGASNEFHLKTLAEKIEIFSNGKQHKVASLWKIIDGVQWKYERILSEALREEWPIIQDNVTFVVDVGVACLGFDEFSDHPKKKKHKFLTELKYKEAVARWEIKRDALYDKWQDNVDIRHDQLFRMISAYGGEELSMTQEDFDYSLSLPDSFTSRIRISGRGLRDIVENYPYVFDISEVDDLARIDTIESSDDDQSNDAMLEIIGPKEDAPSVCIIDSGIQERHILLREAIDDSSSRSWAVSPSNDVADYVGQGGHGTRVAGAVLYPESIPSSGTVELEYWIQNARILESNNTMSSSVFPPKLMREIVQHFHEGHRNTRIFNHSLTSTHPSRKTHMSAWASALDQLCWEYDILFVVAAGNLPQSYHTRSLIRLSVDEHLQAGRAYPDYLLEMSSRIANPAQSLQVITVGSVGLDYFNDGVHESFSQNKEPSSFSCTGPGIFNSVKPEVVEIGGCFVYEKAGTSPRALPHKAVSPALVSSTLHGGAGIRRDKVGTSFAAPKVSHILAYIQKQFPDESTLLYRALLIHSARWPSWARNWPDKLSILRHIGYGLPDKERATENTPYRVTFVTNGDMQISGKQVHIYEVIIPAELRRQASEHDIRIDVTLSFKAQPRRTRRNRQRYLSTWLSWETSKKNESMESFLSRMIELSSEESEMDEQQVVEQGSTMSWMLAQQNNHGQIGNIRRSNNTVQKDWTHIKSYEWGSSFLVAVIGHMGWNKDLHATIPYALAVSFESVDEDLEIYTPIMIANQIDIPISSV